jgi:general secretion pathway protein D
MRSALAAASLALAGCHGSDAVVAERAPRATAETPLPATSPPVPTAPSSPAAARSSDAQPERYAFDFDDASLAVLTERVATITKKRFLYSQSLPPVHATLRSPTPVTADEAYEAFLTILQAHGLTVVTRGGLNTIVPAASLLNR